MDDKDSTYGKSNWIRLNSKLPWRSAFAYIDTNNYRADQLFIRAKLPVSFNGNEMHRDGTDYVIIFCRIKRKDELLFLACMADLERAMLLEGHGDYRKFCEKTLSIFA